MIQFDFLEISGSITDFQTRKKLRILADSPKFCQTYHVFTLFLGHPPEKKVMNSPKDVGQTCSNYPNDEKNGTGRRPQVVSALCFCMDLRPVKSHPTLGVKLVSEWIAVGQEIRWGDFFVWRKENGWVQKKNERMEVTKQKGGVGCEMFLEGSTFGGVNKLYFLGWRGCWNFSKGLLLRSGEEFWAKMLGMPGREFFFGSNWIMVEQPKAGVWVFCRFLFLVLGWWFQSVCFCFNIFFYTDP